MVSKLYRTLSIRESETTLFWLLALHAMCFGVTLSFAYTAATAIFLSQFDETALLWSYVVIAGIGVIVSAAIAFLQTHTSIPTFLNVVIGVVLLSTITFWAGLQYAPHIYIVFGVIVWEQIQFTLAEFEWYGIQGEMLTIQQGKRLMGAVGGVEELAKIGSFLSVPLLLNLLEVHHLLLVAAGFYIVQLVVMQRIFKLQRTLILAGTVEGAAEPTVSNRELVRKPYVQGILLFMGLLIIFEMTINVGFFSGIQLRYQTEAEIAQFIAIFSLALYSSLFVFRSFIAPRLLQRYGAEVGFLALPVCITIATAASWAAGVSFGFESLLFFAAVTAARGIYELIGTGLQETSLMLVFQVMKSGERFKVQNLLQTLVIPMATGLAGGLLLLIPSGQNSSLPINLGTALLTAIAMWVTGRRVIKHYLKDLPQRFLPRRFTDSHLADSPILDVHNAETMQALRLTIAEGSPQQVKLALGIMMRMSPMLPTQADLTLLRQHPSEDVKALASLQIAKLQDQLHPNYKKNTNLPINKMLASDDLRIRQRALIEIGKLRDSRYTNALLSALMEPRLVAAAKRSLVELGSEATPAVQTALNDPQCPIYIKQHLLDVLLVDNHEDTKAFLLALLPSANVTNQHKLMRAINKQGSKAWDADITTLEHQFTQDLALGNFLSKQLFVVSAHPNTEMLVTALEEELENVRQRLVYNMNAQIPTAEMRAATNTLQHGDADSIGLALEYLSMAVTNDERLLFRTLLNRELSAIQRGELLHASTMEETEFGLESALFNLLHAPSTTVSRWLRTTSIHTLGKHPLPRLTNALVAAQEINDPIIRDVAAQALREMAVWEEVALVA